MNWMQQLTSHYAKMKRKYPTEKLMIIFDIDDTIVDIRLPLLYVLKKYDFLNQTTYFADFTVEKITFEEWTIQNWLPGFLGDHQRADDIVNFVRKEMWEKDTILLSHRPFQGVLEIIRWFIIQDLTFIGLNTGRSEILREITLHSLNILAKEFRIEFKDEYLYMNPLREKNEDDITQYKSQGIRHFENFGYKVIAFFDNEPANLQAVSSGLNDDEILLLHADTSFASSKKLTPQSAAVGSEYNFTEVINPKYLPHRVEFVWNGVNKIRIFEKYKKSNVNWAELDVRQHPLDQALVLKHSSFDAPEFDREEMVTFEQMLDHLIPLNRGIKVVLKEPQPLLKRVIEVLLKKKLSTPIWFDILFEMFDIEGLSEIRKNFPFAVISTRVDFLVPLLSQFPEYVASILRNLTKFGINQFSISLHTYNKELFIAMVEQLGLKVNLRDVYSLEEFMQAMILLPRSIISTFNY